MTETVDRREESTAARNDRGAETIDAAHLERVEAGLADVRAGRLAKSEEVEQAFARFHRRP